MPRLGYAGNRVAIGTGGTSPGTIVDTADMAATDVLLEVAAGLYVFDVSGGFSRRVFAAGNIAASDAGSHQIPVVPALFNRNTYDPYLNNVSGTLLASASRSATTASADQANYNARGVRVYLNITVAPGVETLTLQVQDKDPVSGTYNTMLASAAQVATGLIVVEVYPGAAAVANLVDNDALPRTWRVNVVHSAVSAWTYSVGYALIL